MSEKIVEEVIIDQYENNEVEAGTMQIYMTNGSILEFTRAELPESKMGQIYNQMDEDKYGALTFETEHNARFAINKRNIDYLVY